MQEPKEQNKKHMQVAKKQKYHVIVWGLKVF